MKKKLLIISTFFIMCLTLISCASEVTNKENQTEESETKKPKII